MFRAVFMHIAPNQKQPKYTSTGEWVEFSKDPINILKTSLSPTQTTQLIVIVF